MGNCLFSSSRVENQNSSNTSDPSKGNSKSGFSSQPSSQTASSLPSTFTLSASESFLSTSRSESTILSSSNLKAFTLSELKNSTRNFRPDSLLGEGGFGCVFKGWIDEETLTPSKPGSGMVVAVKRLKPEGFQGHKEWLTEVRYLGQLHHPNLVKLLGYCSEGESNRLLVYEFMSRGSLENHLFRRCGQLLPWPTRIKIAIAAARGLSFLHESENQVIYRDVKASNILLDSDFNAKLSDFGLAKAGPTGNQTHVSTQVVGTHGYAAPEYVQTGRLTVKADVYSFGVVLLELLTGKRALDRTRISIEQDLVAWARPYLGDKRKFFRIMDTSLEGQYSKKSAFTVANLSRQCTIQEPKSRPKMSQVLETLEQLLQDSKAVRSRASHLKQSAAAAAATMKPTSRNPRRSPMPPSYSLPSH